MVTFYKIRSKAIYLLIFQYCVIETVTCLLKGEIEHGDSLGNKGVIIDLQCQWMIVGSGIIHQEMPVESERLLGCQLWVNLAFSELQNKTFIKHNKPQEF